MTGGVPRRVLLAVAGLVAAGCGPSVIRAASRPPIEVVPVSVDLGPEHLPEARPADPRPLRVLLVGDGVMVDAVPGLVAAFASTGRALVTDGSRMGIGLTQDGGWGWSAQWSAMVSASRPDVVVVMLGKWDAVPAQVDGQVLAPGAGAWAAWYRARVDGALRILTAGRAEVVWLGMAPEGIAGSAPATAALNDVLRAATEAWPGATFVDTAPVLGGPDGSYVQSLPGPGRTITLRKPDGVHLCPDGVVRLAEATVAAVAAEPQLAAGAGWDAGAWRHDFRYYWAPGGGCPGS